jgi:DNA modification methylase
MTESIFSEIAVTCIVPSPFQHRRMFDKDALMELAKSIETDGLIQPITVRHLNGEIYELIAGERRWRAVRDFTALSTIAARVLVATDLQARRLCATENLQRADLTSLEEVMALCELVDASLMEFSDEYERLSVVQEPKWRVKALLTKLDADRANKTEYFINKFIDKVQEVFSGLPKPKDWLSFQRNDIPLLFTSSEVQKFALEHKLNKAQTKAINQLKENAPAVFREIATATPERAIERLVELSADPARPPVESKNKDFEDVRDLSADTIRQAAKNHKTIERIQAAMAIEIYPNAPIEYADAPQQPIQPAPNPVKEGDWWQLGRHKLYCGDTSKPEFYQDLPTVDFAFADPPYGVKADEWDANFYWAHDWLIDKAPIVAVTPGIVSIFEFAKKTAMPYRWSMAAWITNGMTRGDVGFGNWIYLSLFANKDTTLFRQAQDVIRCTINIAETDESHHRGRKPAEMMAAILGLYCEATVIDPFLGSGTTLLAAEKTGKACVGGEVSPIYCQRIIERWELLTGEKAVKHGE